MKSSLISLFFLLTLSTQPPTSNPFQNFDQIFKSTPQAHQKLSLGNSILGRNNTVNGLYNQIKGHNNFVLGSINEIFGNSNTNLGSYNGIQGNNNWIVGSGHNIKGDGVRMFGPNTSPQFRMSRYQSSQKGKGDMINDQ